MNEHILYELECGQVTFGDFEQATRLECRCLMHGKNERIVRVILGEWLLKCGQCTYRRWYGMDKALAYRESRNHWRRNPSHIPSVSKRERPISRMANLDFRKKVEDMGMRWYNGRVILPGIPTTEISDDIPPF